MAAGAIAVAHNSGGPKMDIVRNFEGEQTGFLADDVESYSRAINTIMNASLPERNRIAMNARRSVQRFSHEDFEEQFVSYHDFLFQTD